MMDREANDMKRIYKVLIIVSIVVLLLVALAWGVYSLAFRKYGFLFPLDGDECYVLQLEMYEVNEQNISYAPVISQTMRYDSARLYDALKAAKYIKTDNSDLHYGERVSVVRKDESGQADKKHAFQLLHDRRSQKVYLCWNGNTYEVTGFDRAREAIQESICQVRPSIEFGVASDTFFAADFFSLPDPNALTEHTDYENTESVVLDSDSDIIAHAQREVKEGYDSSKVYREKYGDRYMVGFDYLFEEDNLYKTVCVLMSKDGVTELVISKVGFIAGCAD